MWNLYIKTLRTHEIMHKTLEELKYKDCNYTDLTIKTSGRASHGLFYTVQLDYFREQRPKILLALCQKQKHFHPILKFPNGEMIPACSVHVSKPQLMFSVIVNSFTFLNIVKAR